MSEWPVLFVQTDWSKLHFMWIDIENEILDSSIRIFRYTTNDLELGLKFVSKWLDKNNQLADQIIIDRPNYNKTMKQITFLKEKKFKICELPPKTEIDISPLTMTANDIIQAFQNNRATVISTKSLTGPVIKFEHDGLDYALKIHNQDENFKFKDYVIKELKNEERVYRRLKLM